MPVFRIDIIIPLGVNSKSIHILYFCRIVQNQKVENMHFRQNSLCNVALNMQIRPIASTIGLIIIIWFKPIQTILF